MEEMEYGFKKKEKKRNTREKLIEDNDYEKREKSCLARLF